MIESKYNDGYEGEGGVLLYYHNGQKEGMLIWEGYFEFLLSACFNKNFQVGGLIESYYNHNGFYETSPWKIKDLRVVIKELKDFKKEEIGTNSPDIIHTVTNLRNELISFLEVPLIEKKDVYIEYP